MIPRTKVTQNFAQRFHTCIFDSYAIAVGAGLSDRVVDFLDAYCREHVLQPPSESAVENHFNRRYGATRRGFEVVLDDHAKGIDPLLLRARGAVTAQDIPSITPAIINALQQTLINERALLCLAEAETVGVHATVFGWDQHGFYRVDPRNASTAVPEQGIVARPNNRILDGLLIQFK